MDLVHPLQDFSGMDQKQEPLFGGDDPFGTPFKNRKPDGIFHFFVFIYTALTALFDKNLSINYSGIIPDMKKKVQLFFIWGDWKAWSIPRSLLLGSSLNIDTGALTNFSFQYKNIYKILTIPVLPFIVTWPR
jgi:hypothetical protein